jgi:hypothetical protein
MNGKVRRIAAKRRDILADSICGVKSAKTIRWSRVAK